MLPVFNSTLTAMLMTFACMAVGYIVNKLKLFPKDMDTVLAKSITYIFAPALIISTFMSQCTVESLISNRFFVIGNCRLTLQYGFAKGGGMYYNIK